MCHINPKDPQPITAITPQPANPLNLLLAPVLTQLLWLQDPPRLHPHQGPMEEVNHLALRAKLQRRLITPQLSRQVGAAGRVHRREQFL